MFFDRGNISHRYDEVILRIRNDNDCFRSFARRCLHPLRPTYMADSEVILMSGEHVLQPSGRERPEGSVVPINEALRSGEGLLSFLTPRRSLPGRVLVIDRDPGVMAGEATQMLRENGLSVTVVSSIREAVALLARGAFDLIIVESSATFGEHGSACRAILEARTFPVVVWGERDSPLDEIAALELGAADFVPKSAHPLTLLARSRAALRRSRALAALLAQAPDIPPLTWLFQPAAGEIRSWRGQRAFLAKGASQLLGALCERAGRIVPREELQQLLGTRNESAASRGLNVAISRLRSSLADCDGLGETIRTFQASGYLLDAVVVREGDGFVIRTAK
jgi:two-component system OmpR family response regulator